MNNLYLSNSYKIDNTNQAIFYRSQARECDVLKGFKLWRKQCSHLTEDRLAPLVRSLSGDEKQKAEKALKIQTLFQEK